MQIRRYDFLSTIVFAAGSGLGWWLAIMLLAAIRGRIENNPVPAGLKGAGITLITIGFMAMGFIGLSGMISVQ
jgi:Na+-transporting NADH:ubiquinone oxidoreductase subunit E